MSDKRTRRLAPKVLQQDLDALDALDAITDYNPSNAAFSKANALAVRTAMREKQAKEVQDAATAKGSRDGAVNGEWDAHEFVQGVGIQTKAQFGENSDEYASLGFKKKIEYKNPTRKAKS